MTRHYVKAFFRAMAFTFQGAIPSTSFTGSVREIFWPL